MAERDRRGTDAADEHGETLAGEGTGRKADTRRGGTAAKSGPRGLGRLGRFIREVVAELRKVIWPTRKELVTYAVVVMVFVGVMMAIVAAYDLVFRWAVGNIFGN